MRRIRVLIADDSVLTRDVISAMLSLDSEIDIVGQARNGKEAVEMALNLKPDVMTMDIEMPLMDGFEAIGKIMEAGPVPILVVSSRSDAGTAYTAISRGALEVFSKSEIDPESPEDFIRKVKSISRIKVISHLRSHHARQAMPESLKITGKLYPAYRMIAIAASTGGPKALSLLLPDFPGDFPCPIVIAQHISDGFVGGMVDWLGKLCRMKVKLAEEGERAQAGTIYVAASETHTRIGGDQRIVLVKRKPDDIFHPSCNLLLSSVAKTYGSKSMGIILTGMGNDGTEGMRSIREAGGMTIAQDEKSSAVFGMPKVAIELGYIQKILPIGKIGSEILELVKGNGRS